MKPFRILIPKPTALSDEPDFKASYESFKELLAALEKQQKRLEQSGKKEQACIVQDVRLAAIARFFTGATADQLLALKLSNIRRRKIRGIDCIVIQLKSLSNRSYDYKFFIPRGADGYPEPDILFGQTDKAPLTLGGDINNFKPVRVCFRYSFIFGLPADPKYDMDLLYFLTHKSKNPAVHMNYYIRRASAGNYKGLFGVRYNFY